MINVERGGMHFCSFEHVIYGNWWAHRVLGGGVEHLNAQLEKGNSDPPLQSADSLCDCQEALDRDGDHDEDRATETQPGMFNFANTFYQESSPIKWIVEVRKDAEQVVGVELLVVVSHLKLISHSWPWI